MYKIEFLQIIMDINRFLIGSSIGEGLTPFQCVLFPKKVHIVYCFLYFLKNDFFAKRMCVYYREAEEKFLPFLAPQKYAER